MAIASVTSRRGRGKSLSADALSLEYVARIQRYCPAELVMVDSEAAMLELAGRVSGRAAGVLVLFDSKGEALSSEGFAGALRHLRDSGAQRLIFGIGPADGWAAATLARADRVVSLGRMTLPHELARVVAAEQIYRALTILAGHPYHTGH